MDGFLPYLQNNMQKQAPAGWAPPVVPNIKNTPGAFAQTQLGGATPWNSGPNDLAANQAARARVLAAKAAWRTSGQPNADLGAFSGRRPMQEVPMNRQPINPWWSNPMQAPRPAVHPAPGIGYGSGMATPPYIR